MFVVEKLNPNFGFFYRVSGTITKLQTECQLLEVIDSPEFGRVLLLDGATQIATKNEFLYHEAMVHPAMTSHSNPRDVLIIGAGDGGVLREVLRHGPSRVILAELDGMVIEVCKQHFPDVSRAAFDDPRVSMWIGDGRQYVEQCSDVFDVIIMDMTDPFGPSEMLYTREFFALVKGRMRDADGLFVMHCESVISRPLAYQQMLRTLGEVWPRLDVFYVYVQMYATLWSIVVCGNRAEAVAKLPQNLIRQRLADRGLVDCLDLYNEDTHYSMMVEYPFITRIRNGAASVAVITDEHPSFFDHVDADNSISVLTIIEE